MSELGAKLSLQTFKESVAKPEPPEGFNLALQALWWDAKGDWEKRTSVLRNATMRQACACMPASIAEKVINRTPNIGIAAAASLPRS